MKKTVIIICLALLTGCGPAMITIPITQEGQKVLLVSKDMAFGLPGRPFDRCAILGHAEMLNTPNDLYYLPFDQIANSLRNETARNHGNVAIYTTKEFLMKSMPGDHPVADYYSLTGIMMRCADEEITASGFKNIVVRGATEAPSNSLPKIRKATF